jgi:hypothetical protein
MLVHNGLVPVSKVQLFGGDRLGMIVEVEGAFGQQGV